jgi:DsbC/DsbD-like thiol-disulfide interchange protein
MGAGAQSLLKATVQHATVAASASAASVAAGGALTLFADVTPNPSIHIYAEGAKDFTPVALVTTPNTAVSMGRVKYPKPDLATAPGATDAVPAYRQTFRVALPTTIKAGAKSGEVITIGGAVNYQACDDHLCYPVTAAPVVWTVTVK